MADIGYFSFRLAFLCALFVVVMSLIGLNRRNRSWLTMGTNALHAITGLFTLAVIALLYLLLQRNFQIKYVAGYTDLTLPRIYVLSALWAGQEGSLLFWGWVLSLCSSIFLWKNPLPAIQPSPSSKAKKRAVVPPPLPTETEFPYILLTFAVVLGFFLILLMVMANPFEQFDFTPSNGRGLEPLLQNFYMAIHPPVLFIGYAGFIVPFALAFAALGSGTIRPERLKSIRRWALFSWYFLGIGIILGAHWAYLELGWGGYWSWDPVENASLIPWLTGTALLHSLALQRRKGYMKLWNLFLCILTFALCIFATFVTRSGMLASVHAFGESAIGYYFLVFLALVFLITAGLLAYRWQAFRTIGSSGSLFLKEGIFFFTNLLFMGLGVVVLFGTLLPFIVELLTGKTIIVNIAFFNRISIPVGLVILGLIGFCQRVPWKAASSRTLAKQLLIPLAIAFLVTLGIFEAGVRHWLTLITCWLGLFVCTTMIFDVWETLQRRFLRKAPEEAPGRLLFRTFAAQKRLYAAYIFHVGVVLVYIGIAVSSAYRLEREATLRPGESVTLGDIRFQYGQLDRSQDAQKVTIAADITVYRGEKKVAVLTPERRIYGKGEDSQMTTEIGLHSSLKNDIYVILAGWKEDQTATFTLILHPLILWIWIGGFVVFTVGFIVAVLPIQQPQSQATK